MDASCTTRRRRKRAADSKRPDDARRPLGNMSAYQKFIASASPPRSPPRTPSSRQVSASSAGEQQQQRRLKEPECIPLSQRVCISHQNHNERHQSQVASPSSKITMMRQHSHVPSAGVQLISSTPLGSRRQLWAPDQHASCRPQARPSGVSRVQIQHQPSVYGQRRPTADQQRVAVPQSPEMKAAAAAGRTTQATSRKMINSLLQTKDPLLLEWLRAMRFETELECLTSLQARTLAIDEHSAGALSVRNSQVSIQEIRAESSYILDYIDCLIDALPLDELQCSHSLLKFAAEFSELWARIVQQTGARTATSTSSSANSAATYQQNNLTIINCTPRKAPLSAKTLQPLDKLAVQIRNLCFSCARSLDAIQNQEAPLDNGQLESTLRRLKEFYGKFVEISIRSECANVVRALNYDFSQSSLNRLSSSSSLLPVRPFESSGAQLPLKWALIALWQLTKDDSYLCRVLTEKWQTVEPGVAEVGAPRPARRLDYSTPSRAEDSDGFAVPRAPGSESSGSYDANSLRSDYQKLYEICQKHHYGKAAQADEVDQENGKRVAPGALNSALRSKHQRLQSRGSVSTIELLIEVIVSQPNKHERLDMMSFIHSQAQSDKLIDIDEWDQSVSAAIFTSNQYKVAALRILNHLCVNEQAVKTLLRCFSTPPPARGQPMPVNRIIRSIFECYQTAQEHIYQNDTVLRPASQQRKRSRQQAAPATTGSLQSAEESDEYSDYGSRQTSSIPAGGSQHQDDAREEDGDDVVVREALRLIIQLTTVFHRSNQGHDYYTLIGRFSIESLVKYLTNIIKSTGSREMLFLSLTALANISFITTEPMKIYGTNRIILELFRASRSRSKDLELRDQAVTILANTADKNPLDTVNDGGLTFLLSCLESCPSKMTNYRPQPLQSLSRLDSPLVEHIDNQPRNRRPIDLSNEQYPDFLDCACDQQQVLADHAKRALFAGQSNSYLVSSLCLGKLSRGELAAMERIHQKAAVAFARMSTDPNTTRLVLEYGGVKQLVDLCKLASKRNYSDTVLIACIAALRKMSKVIDSEIFKNYNSLDLIELDLNRALEIYGNAREQTGQDLLFASDV